MTTNVSNFIMGSPLIDHYGDLVVSKRQLCYHATETDQIIPSSESPDR